MKKSFMQFLAEQPLYKRNSESKYNPFYIVQLRRNHRNHAKILSISDNLFYDKTLIAEASKGMGFFSTVFLTKFLIN